MEEQKTVPSALDLTIYDWKRWVKTHGYPSFVASQIIQWIYQKGCQNPELFTNLSLNIRNQLKQEFSWNLLTISTELTSEDTSVKFLLNTRDNQVIEMVLMSYDKRTTLCISSQAGCRMGCTFCQTGKLGLKRNLTKGEILEQILLANNHLQKIGSDKKVRNIVFMGMGEPLDNFDEVVEACRIMIDPDLFALSKSRVTVSTSGLVPEIERLGKTLPVRLAISLHSTDDEKRSKMMPVNRKWDLQTLKNCLLNYPAEKDGITFEYVMIAGVNDSIGDAKKLVSYIHGLKAKVNLIPLNHFPGNPMRASENQRLQEFQSYLSRRSIPAPIRYSKGQDISGGCGQLAAKKQDELHLDPRQMRRKLYTK